MSHILAINSGLNASAGVFNAGKPIFCIQEERLCREKNFGGFPEKSISHILSRIAPVDEIQYVVFTNSRPELISKLDYINKYHQAFIDASKAANESSLISSIKKHLRTTPFFEYLKKRQIQKSADDKSWLLSKGFSLDQIQYVDHHLCHAAAAYYGLARDLKEPYLIFTLDGGGDDRTSTVYKGQNGVLEPIDSSGSYSVGNIYSAVTYFLGFTPHEHEYKLMGLSPYVNKDYSKRYRDFFKKFVEVVDGNFRNPYFLRHSILMSELIKGLKASRFDNISAGLQLFTEELITEWVGYHVKKTGIKKVLCSGGVFMNVKANQKLAELDKVEFIDVFPSCGDETNIFGAAFFIHNRRSETKSIGLLNQFTLGSSPKKDLELVLETYADRIEWKKLDNPAKNVAQLLAENKIVARCVGNMEFGARALGNRSILANPSNLSNVAKINRAVKKRDFWMPFAPAILEEDLDQYFDVPSSLKDQKSPYMMFSFKSKEPIRDSIICGLHQGDHTGRAQSVSKALNPGFYDLIKEFKKITGIPVLLNTSFNLHGYPIVSNSKEAISVMLNSEIDYLLLDHYLLSKKMGSGLS